MNAIMKQAARMGRLDTALGADVLVLQRFEGIDALNALFDYQVDGLATDPEIDFDVLIGTHATVTLRGPDGEDRPFDGLVAEARWLGPGENGHRYRLTLKPWFYLAMLRRNQRIFHSKTVVQILQEVLADHAGGGKAEIKLAGDYPVLEYTVQYRESDFAFCCRMMERFGISYHFTHQQGAHLMVLTDAPEAHDSIGTRPFHPAQGAHLEEVEHFSAWRPARRLTTGAIRLTDYNFKSPMAAMVVQRQGDAAYAQGQIESYDYPGDYLDQAQGRGVNRKRLEAARGQDHRYEAAGDIAALGGGLQVTLGGDPVPGRGETYLCLWAQHSYVSDSYGTGGQASDGRAYSGTYLLMPAKSPLMPELKTPPALVLGPQTAMVVGAGEIDCDDHGRILVRFHWDLAGAHSMRCRVSQSSAGNGWGSMVIPRIGMEVVVEFLEGDPDKPLVTGCVYNGQNRPPYDLPANKTRTTFKSDTHQGRGHNELRFEDKAGAEEIHIHAQYDRNETTLHDHSEQIVNNWSQTVGNCKSITVGVNHDETIGAQFSQTVGASKTVNVGVSHSETIGAMMTLSVGAALTETIGAVSSRTVGGAHMLTVGGPIAVTTGASMTTSVARDATETIGKILAIDVGDAFILQVGAAKLEMKKDGSIKLSGKQIDVKGSSGVKLKGSKIEHN